MRTFEYFALRVHPPDNNPYSDSFTILGLWVLVLAVSHMNESNFKLMSPEHYF